MPSLWARRRMLVECGAVPNDRSLGRRIHRSRRCTPGRARIRGRGGPRLPRRIARCVQTLLRAGPSCSGACRGSGPSALRGQSRPPARPSWSPPDPITTSSAWMPAARSWVSISKAHWMIGNARQQAGQAGERFVPLFFEPLYFLGYGRADVLGWRKADAHTRIAGLKGSCLGLATCVP